MNGGTADQRWLSSMLPFVRGQLPAAPGRVIEIGCGPLGGFVPALAGDGYDSVGVDPEAPEGPDYHRIEFERYDAPGPADAVVACTSLHHVRDLDTVLDKVAAGLVAGGTIVVIEWAHERFDEATARWCFDRLGAAGSEEGWLHHHRDAWRMTGVDWDTYHTRWADEEALHTGAAILDALDARFRPVVVQSGPYFFPALEGASAAVEQAAIDSDRIRPTGIRFVGRLPVSVDPTPSDRTQPPRGETMPAPFVFVTTHRVGDGSLDELRTAAARYAQFVEANEPGMLAHCSYLDEDGRELSLVHVHSTAEAADRHMKAAADLIGQGVALTDGNVRIEVYGAPGPVLAQALEANAANGTQVSVKAENLAGFARHVSA